jgi:hypothetical protein
MAAQRSEEPPAEFRRALTSLRAAAVRPEVALEEAPAPQRLAPYAVAMTADVVAANAAVDGGDDHELATGRLVLLHDPAGHEAWGGTFRLVTYVRADLEPEMAVDPLLPSVGWAWLLEALQARGIGYTAASGTVTRVTSESFGAMDARPASAEIEIRASWTPQDAEVGPHLSAWCDLLCTAAGLPPLPPGVVAMPARRGVRAR